MPANQSENRNQPVQPSPAPTPPPPPAAPPAQQPYNGYTLKPPYGATIDAQLEAAKQDLAQRLGIGAEAVEVVQVQAVTWPDRALGCPQPGLAYPQVLVEGILVQLRANGQVYNYHGDGRNPLFLCDPQAGPVDKPVRPPRDT